MHSPLEQYLEEVETRLIDLSAEKRQSELEEMRQHLQDSIEARIELGCSQEEAIAYTLEQFGRAQQIGAELALVHERKAAGWRGTLLAATACAYVFGIGISLLRDALLPALFFFADKGSHLIIDVGWWCASLVMVSFLTGWTTAMFSPRKAVQGSALAYILSFVLPYVVASLHSSVPSAVPLDMQVRLLAHNMILTLIAILIATSSAKMGVRWKQARKRRMRLA